VRSTHAAEAVAELGSLDDFASAILECLIHQRQKGTPSKMKHTFPLVAAILCPLLFSACDNADQPLIAEGKTCTIYFRRDALGFSANEIFSPMTAGINDGNMTIGGRIKKIGPEWITIETMRDELTIPEDVAVPKGVILFIKQQTGQLKMNTTL
jgi:hypothetical protein